MVFVERDRSIRGSEFTWGTKLNIFINVKVWWWLLVKLDKVDDVIQHTWMVTDAGSIDHQTTSVWWLVII